MGVSVKVEQVYNPPNKSIIETIETTEFDEWFFSMARKTLDPEVFKWFNDLPFEVQRDFLGGITQQRDAPGDTKTWLRYFFPDSFNGPFSKAHTRYWNYVDSIDKDKKVPAYIMVLGRGGGKSTNMEATPIKLGADGVKKFALYIRHTQDKANETIQNISALLEGRKLGDYYPALTSRKLGKYGNARGWNMQEVRCSNGLSILGYGLDVASRGVKIEGDRPDLIILDDIDHELDDIKKVDKKIKLITRSILPTGSTNVTVLGGQNVIHENSIFNLLVKDKADFLLNRIVDGPYPAIENLEYDLRYDEKTDRKRYYITGGIPMWEGQNIETCENQMNEWGLDSFLTEAQHDVEEKAGGIFSDIEFERVEQKDLPEMVNVVVWCDPAITTTDNSDAMAIQADGLGVDGKIYKLYSYEEITTPERLIRKAILMAIKLKASRIGIETDQGGDTWLSVIAQATKTITKNYNIDEAAIPPFTQAKAGQGHGSKVHRAQQMKLDYEFGLIVHAINPTTRKLEKALNRFPKVKPYDLVDANYWSWKDLKGGLNSLVW